MRRGKAVGRDEHASARGSEAAQGVGATGSTTVPEPRRRAGCVMDYRGAGAGTQGRQEQRTTDWGSSLNLALVENLT